VLGFWSGSFISLSLLVNILANGVNYWLFIIPFLLIVTAFIYPLFGKKNHYCTWICPLGACQELLNKSVPYKISISNRVLKYLDYFREGLFIFLLTIMWLGVGFEAMDYELFSVFLFQSASSYLLIAGAVFAVLSCFVQRPYCRFVCPTGSLFKFSERSK
ncbi:MAG: 4Fe-4S binding protein, partial [Phocaeicola sp.]